jgi:protein farnesyltransferase/geranylgeranyltransferase type-1 subunit alpha
MTTAFQLPDIELYADVTPIPPTTSSDDVLGIPYSATYAQTISLYRALLNSLELSERALALVTVINVSSPSNPTPWWYRQQIIAALGYSLDAELRHCFRCLKHGPKPYQVWCHRVWLMSREDQPPDESDFFVWVIAQDLCNFHAWTYFGWYAERFRRWTWLFEMSTGICRLYPRNNSAWAARFRALKMAALPLDDEVDFALELLDGNHENQSLCAHLRGLVGLDPSGSTAAKVRGRLAVMIANRPARQLYILDAQLARSTGKLEEYAEILGKLAELDPPRARAYAALQADSPLYQ